MAPKIVALYAALLAVMYVVLTVRVILVRVALKASLGDGGGDTRLLRAVRAHGNFAEFVPFAVVLIALAEMNGTPPLYIAYCGTPSMPCCTATIPPTPTLGSMPCTMRAPRMGEWQ